MFGALKFVDNGNNTATVGILEENEYYGELLYNCELKYYVERWIVAETGVMITTFGHFRPIAYGVVEGKRKILIIEPIKIHS